MSEKWDRHFLGMALYHSRMSKDPETRVGSVIIGPNREILGLGFNGFPRGIEDTPERLNNRELKLKLMVHAERNAQLDALVSAKKGCTLYLACTDDSGLVWGGPPCSQCSGSIITARYILGIDSIVSFPIKVDSKWFDDLQVAKGIILEAGIKYRELPLER